MGDKSKPGSSAMCNAQPYINLYHLFPLIQYEDLESRLESLQAAFSRQQDAHDKELEDKCKALSHLELNAVEMSEQVSHLKSQLETVESKNEMLLRKQIQVEEKEIVHQSVCGHDLNVSFYV